MDAFQKNLSDMPPSAVLCVGFPGSERSEVERALGSIGLRATWARTHRQALSALSRLPSIVLVDLIGDDAFRTVRVLRARQRGIVVIGVVDATERNVTAEAVRAGVVVIARKPLVGHELAAVVERARQFRAISAAQARLTPVADSVFVRSAGMRRAVELAVRAGAGRGGLVMVGEPGTGRELLARTIHRFDGQECENFVVVDCAAARPGGVEVELFGTGLDLVGAQPQGSIPLGGAGALYRAHGGTLFIKNVGELSPRWRARLARVLEHRRVCAGRRRYFELDVRLIFSAEPSARNELAWADFSPTTEFEQIRLPALRERREDIPLLANYFLDRIGALPGATRKALTPAAVTLLTGLRWRGNADELNAVLIRLVTQVPGEVIRLEDLLDAVELDGGLATANKTLHEARARFERDYIISVLDRHHGRVRDAARALGIRRTNLYRKLRQMRLRATRELHQPLHDGDPAQASTAMTPAFGVLRGAPEVHHYESSTESSSS